MDVYDSMRPLAITSRLFGIFPVANTRARPYTRKWIFSFTTPLLFIALNVLRYMKLREEKWGKFQKSDVGSITYVINYFNMNLTMTVLFIVVQFNFKRVCN